MDVGGKVVECMSFHLHDFKPEISNSFWLYKNITSCIALLKTTSSKRTVTCFKNGGRVTFKIRSLNLLYVLNIA